MMITYYPDGSWDTEEFTSEEIDRMWQELRAKNVKDETIKTIRDLLQFMINTEEEAGEEYYTENCDGDCRHCDYEDDCEECDDLYEDEDEDAEQYNEEYDEPAEDTATVEPAISCEHCEYYCAGFSCSKSIKKKKGCEK